MIGSGVGKAPLIAIVGCDGSGKSTVSAAVLEWIQGFAPAAAAHLGKQSGNVGRALAQAPLIGGGLEKVIARKSETVRVERDKKTPGLLSGLVIYGFTLRRLSRFRRMMKTWNQGVIIVTDRFPQLDVPGAYDGTGMSTQAAGNPFMRLLARLEQRHFEWMTAHRPDLVVRLNIDLETAFARKPDHRRESLALKIAATPKLTFNGAKIVEVDAAQPLDVVVAQAKAAVREMLVARGYLPPPL